MTILLIQLLLMITMKGAWLRRFSKLETKCNIVEFNEVRFVGLGMPLLIKDCVKILGGLPAGAYLMF